MSSDVVSTKEIDYLDEDKPLRGQNYVCLSFISPEDILIDKEIFFFSKFTETYSAQVTELLNGLKAKYPDDEAIIDVVKENNAHMFDVKELQDQYRFYKGLNSQVLEGDFLKINDYKTSMRGIKVRGVFDTIKEAQTRCDVLKRMGDKFDIYVAQVGCWCPWSPNPEDLQDQEYAESTLNTLMKKYKDNLQSKDEVYEQRKLEKIVKAKSDNDRKMEELKLAAATESVANVVITDNTADVTPLDAAAAPEVADPVDAPVAV